MPEPQTEPAQPAEPAAKPDVRVKNAFAYPGFIKLIFGAFLGALGDRFYQTLMIATSSVIFFQDTADKQAGRVQILSLLPMLVLYGFVGSLVDSVDRRKLLAWIEGVKVILVLAFAVLLWNVGKPGYFRQSAEIPSAWSWGLALVVLLNIITVPFSPARAAIVPDVLPVERRSMGASLIATAGLSSYLMGAVGMMLASPVWLGPAYTALIAAGMFLISTLLFRALPDAAGVPGNQRHGDADAAVPETAPKKMTVGEYFRELWDGLRYCFKRPSIFALIIFETAFWTIASMILILLFFYASHVLGISGDAKNFFIAFALGAAGIGLFGGALGAGKLAPSLSPVFTYFPAYAFIAIGWFYVFNSQPVDAVVNGALVHSAPWSFYPLLFMLALGGGMMLGRVDADILSIADERYRGRIFSIKAVIFAACTLATMIYLNEIPTIEQKFALIRGVPRVMFWTLPVVFILAWMVDTAIWAHRTDFAELNFRRRIQWRMCRFFCWLWVLVQFRFTYRNAENVPKTGPVILAANHGSFLDPIFLGCASPRVLQYLMYTSYYTSFMHPLFRFLSTIPVDEKKNLQALKTGVASLQHGVCVAIFPEGQVAYEKKLYPPQGGALFLAQRSGAQVVPVAIKGNWDAWPRWQRFPGFSKVTVIFGKPFTVSKDLSKQETADLARKMMADIAAILEIPPPADPST